MRLPFVLCLLGLALAARAEFVPDPAQRAVDLPPQKPVPVRVNFFLLDINAINGAEETFNAALYFDVTWNDPRLRFDAEAFGADRAIYTGEAAVEQLERMWSPEITASNATGDAEVVERVLTIRSDGTVEFEVRMVGQFSSPMELSRFPFDSQKLSIQLESFVWNSDEVQLEASRDLASYREDLVLRDWRILDVTTSIDEQRYVTGDTYSRFTSTILVQRESWFYIWSILFPLGLVTFFAFLCFFWDQETLSERVAQVLTCLLTVTAQSLAVSDDLPKISYFTRIDYAFLLTYFVLLIVAVESIYAKMLNERNHALADRIDYRAAWAVSLAYLAGMLLVFFVP